MKLYSYKFTVVGTLQFPIDMLRYDECFPDTEHDTYEILKTDPSLQGGDGPYTVTLRKKSEVTLAFPSYERWKSFGWTVLSVDDPDVVKKKSFDDSAYATFKTCIISWHWLLHELNKNQVNGKLPDSALLTQRISHVLKAMKLAFKQFPVLARKLRDAQDLEESAEKLRNARKDRKDK